MRTLDVKVAVLKKGEREKKRIHQPFGLVPEPQAAVQRRVYIKEMPHVPLNI